jgi:hypothetical protein
LPGRLITSARGGEDATRGRGVTESGSWRSSSKNNNGSGNATTLLLRLLGAKETAIIKKKIGVVLKGARD